jgi:succinate-semialdehyde dehydrogenase/glutarate-semialdehyde dehydrogenase
VFGSTAPRQRAEWLRAAFEALTARSEDIAAIITAETGKPLTQARGEVVYGAEFLRWFAEQAARVRGGYGLAPDGRSRNVTARRAVGPSLLVTPWNFPLAMLTRKLGAALAAGCTTIIKPAAQTPLTATLLAEILHEIGLPARVVNVVPTTRDAPLSQVLMADARLRKVSFTGSTAAGSTLIRQSAEHVQRTSMELGGNGPFLVFDDADIDAAVGGAMVAKFRNGGQSCVAANRFLLHRRIADEFTENFVSAVRELRLGGGFDPAATIGPLIVARQRDKVADLVEDAIANGAKVHAGGRAMPGEGYFYEPTVLTDVSLTARIGPRRSSAPWPRYRSSTAKMKKSAPPTTSPKVSRPSCTPATSPAPCVSVRRWKPEWSASTPKSSLRPAPLRWDQGIGSWPRRGETGIDEFLETTYLALNIAEPTSTSNNHS